MAELDTEHLFDDILERDEKIIKIIKPSKKRFFRDWLLPFIFPIFLPHFIIFMVVTLFFVLPLLHVKSYKNTYYAYTNKRLISRGSAIGVDYHSLEYKDITATSVDVGFLDKMGKGKKTGTLAFKSPSAGISFKCVESPYEQMREIKEYIASLNAEQTQAATVAPQTAGQALTEPVVPQIAEPTLPVPVVPQQEQEQAESVASPQEEQEQTENAVPPQEEQAQTESAAQDTEK